MQFVKQFRTQKAKGLYELRKADIAKRMWPGAAVTAIKAAEVWPHGHYDQLPAFARPCPTVPRHGFVDSRPVHNLGEVLRVISETLKADPLGEVIFMPIINAEASGIVTNAGVAIGPNNDGATTGYLSYTIPSHLPKDRWRQIMAPKLKTSSNKLYEDDDDDDDDVCHSDWSIKDTPYVEWVANGDCTELVQCRDGPETPQSDNYIPEDVTVTKVVKAGGDLLQWETQVQKLAGKKGVVVCHLGGSLSSHYAVHCILHKIPVFITLEPDVGKKYKAESETPSWSETDFKYLANSMKIMTSLRANNNKSQVCMAIAAMHACPQWAPKNHLIDLIGIGATLTARYIAAACAGEGRHFWAFGPGRHDIDIYNGKKSSRFQLFAHYGDINYKKFKPIKPWRSNLGCLLATAERDCVYEQAFDWPWQTMYEHMAGLQLDFESEWRGGYGGNKWANVASAGRRLIEAINKFIVNPYEKTLNDTILSWNVAINTAHNGGKVLNKWVRDSHMTSIGEFPAFGFTHEEAYQVCSGAIWGDTKLGLGLD